MGMQHRRNFEESGEALLLVRKLVQPQVCGGVAPESEGAPGGKARRSRCGGGGAPPSSQLGGRTVTGPLWAGAGGGHARHLLDTAVADNRCSRQVPADWSWAAHDQGQ